MRKAHTKSSGEEIHVRLGRICLRFAFGLLLIAVP
jgi:hypothetical protein